MDGIEFLNLLFRPDECTYVGLNGPAFIERPLGPINTIQPGSKDLKMEYFCLNPLEGRKVDLNVTAYRNFLIEFDTIDLDQQLHLLSELEKLIPIRTITYSGYKSYHAVISLIDDLGFPVQTEFGVKGYNQTFHNLRQAATEALLPHVKGPINGDLIDNSNCNASRYSRLAGGLNRQHKHLKLYGTSIPETEQKLIRTGSLCSVEQLLAFIEQYRPALTPEVTFEPPKTCVYVYSFDRTLRTQSHLYGLKKKLQIPQNWASTSGNRPHIFTATLWAIDSTGVSMPEFLEYVHRHVTPYLADIGYQNAKQRVEDAVRGAYNWKFLNRR